MYTIQFTNSSLRIFKKLPASVQEYIKTEAVILKNYPLKGEPLKGIFNKLRSLHLSHKGTNYRIIYRIYPKMNLVLIFLADKRENIYKRLEKIL